MNNLYKKSNIILLLMFKSILNTLKAISFNILVLFIGFGLGYYSLALKVHYYATINSEYKYVQKLENHIKSLEQMDIEYVEKQRETLEFIKQLKYKISHDEHHECDSNIGKVLYK